jgi:hypothetical protein
MAQGPINPTILFATWQQKVRVHKVFSENTQDGTTKQVIGCLESLLLLWRKLFGLPLYDMHDAHRCQPIRNPLLPTFVDVIGTLDVEEKARAKDKTHGKGIAGSSSANLVQKKNHNAFKKKNKPHQNKSHQNKPLSSSRKSRQLGSSTAVVARNTSLQSVRIARIRKMARVPTWLLVKLVERWGTVIFYLQFFQYVIHLIGGLTLVLIFMFVLTFHCFPLTRRAEFPPC